MACLLKRATARALPNMGRPGGFVQDKLARGYVLGCINNAQPRWKLLDNDPCAVLLGLGWKGRGVSPCAHSVPFGAALLKQTNNHLCIHVHAQKIDRSALLKLLCWHAGTAAVRVGGERGYIFTYLTTTLISYEIT